MIRSAEQLSGKSQRNAIRWNRMGTTCVKSVTNTATAECSGKGNRRLTRAAKWRSCAPHPTFLPCLTPSHRKRSRDGPTKRSPRSGNEATGCRESRAPTRSPRRWNAATSTSDRPRHARDFTETVAPNTHRDRASGAWLVDGGVHDRGHRGRALIISSTSHRARWCDTRPARRSRS